MAVFYHCTCVAPSLPSLVKIANPGEHPPAVGTFHRGRGVPKRPWFGRGRGPGRTMTGSKKCDKCNLDVNESVFHFMAECPKYDQPRHQFMEKCINILGIERFRAITGRVDRGLKFFLGFEEGVPDQLMDNVK